MSKINLKSPGLLRVHNGSESYTGGDQEWYYHKKHRLSGCGPTAVANAVYYLARNGKLKYDGIDCGSALSKEGFARLMRDIIEYVTPSTFGGLPSTALLAEGVDKLLAAKKIKKRVVRYSVSMSPFSRRPYDEFKGLVAHGLQNDTLPIFLTLSNGKDKNLYTWHWINILSLDTRTELATICDNTKVFETNLSLWHKTSLLGGGAVLIL